VRALKVLAPLEERAIADDFAGSLSAIHVPQALCKQSAGEKPGITLSPPKWYMTRIFGKLDVRNRTQAMVRARQLKLL
jgi:LuxR family maltose regulon positive regulatory protein